MFEERSIPILAYNLETVPAEKLETVISRGILNTRMRDYYDFIRYKIRNSQLCGFSESAGSNMSKKRVI